MIRRPWRNASGVDCWLLISQVEHARISGKLAEAWTKPLLGRPDTNAELLAAIAHHDDGWADWERNLQLDPELGRPRDFTEMPQADSLAIWTRSIGVAEGIGPLAAYCVSRHFCLLLQRFANWDRMPREPAALARAFLDDQQRQQAGWLSKCSNIPASRRSQVAEHAAHWLQWFDALSLWLCCAQRAEPHAMQTPAGQTVDFQPQRAQPATEPDAEVICEFAVAPWPFAGAKLELQTTALAVPAARYGAWQDLADAAAGQVTVHWIMTPVRAGAL